MLAHLGFYWIDTPQFYIEKLENSKEDSRSEYYEGRIKQALENTYSPDSSPAVRRYLVSKHRHAAKETKVTLGSLFGVRFRRQMVAGIMFQYFQQFGGINFFILYATKVFDSIGQSGKLANLVIAICNCTGAIIIVFIIDRFDRKTIFLTGILLQGVAFLGFCLMLHFDWYVMLYPTIVLYMVPFAIGMGGTMFAWLVETLPPTGVGFCWMTQWIFCGMVAQFSPIMVDVWPGVLGAMILYTSQCFLGFFLLDLLCVETKGKTKLEVDEEYSSMKYRIFNYFHKK